jgi:hypothetical protein
MWFLRLLGLVGLVLLTAARGEIIRITPVSLTGAAQPQLAVAPDGTIHAVFGAEGAVFHTRSTDGHTFSNPVRIAALEKLALGKRRGPRVVASDDFVAVTAISHATGNLHAWTSTDGGLTWKDTGALNTSENSAREGLHAMAGNGDGMVVVAWLDLRSGQTELWCRVSSDGGRTWQSDSLAYAAPDGGICECCHPSLAIGPDGMIVAMWRNSVGGDRDPWMAISTDQGKSFANPSKLGKGSWQLAACPMDGGSIAIQADGSPVTAWRREGNLFTAIAGEPELLLAANAAQPVILGIEGGLAVAYEMRGEIMLSALQEQARSLGKGHSPALARNSRSAFIAWETKDGLMLSQVHLR